MWDCYAHRTYDFRPSPCRKSSHSIMILGKLVESTSKTIDDLKLYRAMQADADRLPRVGPKGRMLGVRIQGRKIDLPVTDGNVKPETGGLSVTMGVIEELPFHRLPRRLGGEGKDPVFMMTWKARKGLALQPSGPPHYEIEPSEEMSLDRYEAYLEGTRNEWTIAYE